jgi:hypothetical protein
MVAAFGRARETASGLVTCVAIFRRAQKYAALMATLAACSGVCAGERKASQRVVNLRAASGCLRISEIGNKQSCREDRHELEDREHQPMLFWA